MNWVTKYPYRDSNVVFKKIDEQIMAIRLDEKPIGKDEVNIFNSTGARIWELLDGKSNVEEIIQIMCNEFEVDCKKAKKEVIDFISDLLKKKLIVI